MLKSPLATRIDFLDNSTRGLKILLSKIKQRNPPRIKQAEKVDIKIINDIDVNPRIKNFANGVSKNKSHINDVIKMIAMKVPNIKSVNLKYNLFLYFFSSFSTMFYRLIS